MEMCIIAVFDSKSEAFLPPFFVRATGIAERWFEAQFLNEESDFFRFPEDYTLFYLGSFMDGSGEFRPFDAHRPIVTGVTAKAKVVKMNKADAFEVVR